jgi:hypothetical protein
MISDAFIFEQIVETDFSYLFGGKKSYVKLSKNRFNS